MSVDDSHTGIRQRERERESVQYVSHAITACVASSETLPPARINYSTAGLSVPAAVKKQPPSPTAKQWESACPTVRTVGPRLRPVCVFFFVRVTQPAGFRVFKCAYVGAIFSYWWVWSFDVLVVILKTSKKRQLSRSLSWDRKGYPASKWQSVTQRDAMTNPSHRPSNAVCRDPRVLAVAPAAFAASPSPGAVWMKTYRFFIVSSCGSLFGDWAERLLS